VFNEEMRFICSRYPEWGVVYLGGHVPTYGHKERHAEPLNERVRAPTRVYQTHAFLVRSTVVSEILELLHKGYAADAAYAAWSKKKCNMLRTFLFDPQLLVQPGLANRWKDSDIFIEGEFFKGDAAKLNSGSYKFTGAKSKKPARRSIARWTSPSPQGTSAFEELPDKNSMGKLPGAKDQSTATVISEKARHLLVPKAAMREKASSVLVPKAAPGPRSLLQSISIRKAATGSFLSEPARPMSLLHNISVRKAATDCFLSKGLQLPPSKKYRRTVNIAVELPVSATKFESPYSDIAVAIARAVTPCRARAPVAPPTLSKGMHDEPVFT